MRFVARRDGRPLVPAQGQWLLPFGAGPIPASGPRSVRDVTYPRTCGFARPEHPDLSARRITSIVLTDLL
jgi:hypothetical protein